MNWLTESLYILKGSSGYVQVALLGIRLLMKFIPPLFDLLSEAVDEGFELIEAWKAAGKDKKEAQELARENAVQKAMRAMPEIPETTIRARLEDMVEIKKAVRYGKERTIQKEAEGVAAGRVNLYELEVAKQTYPKLFGFDE